MGFLKKLFRRSESGDEDALRRQFDEEWRHSLELFAIVTGLGEFSLNLKHPETGQPMEPHAGLAGSFSDWKEIHAAYERRRLFLELIYEAMWERLSAWQAANYLSAVRHPDTALEVLEEEGEPTDQDELGGYAAARARALLGLTRYADALVWANKAVIAEPDNHRFHVLRADALHTTGECEEAHGLYSRMMEKASRTSLDHPGAVRMMFQRVFALDTGVCPSPMLAIDLADSLGSPEQSQEFWTLAETEFYDSPYFRMHHAYALAKQDAMDHSFVKLAALVQEMPWIREASLNLDLYFRELDPSGKEIMPELQTALRQRILENGWTVEGMHVIELHRD